MNFVIFCHSLVSDWDHGHAHFLRGITTELLARGHDVVVYEPRGGSSRRQLERERGNEPLEEFARAYPHLASMLYDPATLDLDLATAGADVVLVHERTDPLLVSRIGEHRARRGRYKLLFHDTHHRMVTAPQEMDRYDLENFDGVLAFGSVIADLYHQCGMRAWTWHQAADTRIFRPLIARAGSLRDDPGGDVVWIGNWGDDERSEEMLEMLLEPVRKLRLKARVYGVRYPQSALRALERCGIEYRGWLPNSRVPEIFARYRMTVHIPRRPYRQAIHGVPTIRVFEALSCGIPLICMRWHDSDGLFRPGKDYLEAGNGAEMTGAMARVLGDDTLNRELALQGRKTILARHTCTQRVDELLRILRELEFELSRGFSRQAPPVAAGAATAGAHAS